MPEGQHIEQRRAVYLPLDVLSKCAVCKKKKNLRLCSSCGERIYCSAECQKSDWPSHKKGCGKTDRINLSTFYPFLACLVEQCHVHQEKPLHFALLHKIVNAPNPKTSPYDLPGGSAAKVVMLGEPHDLQQLGDHSWWPSAASPKVRSKLMRRITREGFVLPILTSVCIALLAQIYTTTSETAPSAGAEQKRRVRLRYRSSPIADFGIVRGSADVKSQDKLAYININDGTVTRGQDPDDHYWIYFTTVRGEDILLDCAMFTFNMCLMVSTSAYMPSSAPPFMPFAPVFFRDREFDRTTPDLHKEHKRVSVLRNTDLHAAVANSSVGFAKADARAIWSLMENISGRQCTQKEKDLAIVYTLQNFNCFSTMLNSKAWQKFPAEPPMAIETDPGELDGMNNIPDDDWLEYMKKWRRLQKRGLATNEEVGAAFRAHTGQN